MGHVNDGVMMKHELIIESFTVSYSMETHKNGQRESHFVSVAVKPSEPTPVEDLPLLQLRSSLQVTAAVIQNAVSRQSMGYEEATQKLKEIKQNIANLEQNILDKRAENR